MIIYRIFDSVITVYLYSRGAEALHANVKLYVAAIAAGVGAWIVLELLLGFGLFSMAKKRNIEKRYLAFIPFVNMLYAGRLAGDTRLFGQRMKHAGVFVMAAQIVAVLVGGFTIFAKVTLHYNYVLQPITDVATGRVISYSFKTPVGGNTPASKLASFLIAYVDIASLILSIAELVYSIFLFLVSSALFRRYAPRAFTALSVVALFIPASFPIIVFVLRNRQPIDYAAYLKKQREAYYRRFGAPGGGYGGFGSYGGYNNSPYGGGYGGYGGGSYGSAGSDDPFRENGENGGGNNPSDEPFSELGGSGNGNVPGGKPGNKDGDSPFSDIDG